MDTVPGERAGAGSERAREQARGALVERLRRRLPEAFEAVRNYTLAAVPAVAGESEVQLAANLREVVGACLECGLLAIEQGEEWSGPTPPVVLAQARRAARDGVDGEAGLHRYRAAYEAAWDFVLAEIVDMQIGDRDRAVLLREASTATTSLLVRLLAEVSQVRLSELGREARTREQHTDELVRRVLTGRRIDGSEIGYDFENEHLGIVVRGEGASTTLRVLAERLGRRLLAVPQQDGTVWAWLGGRSRLAPTELEPHLPSGTQGDFIMAVGRPARGWHGFRRTHRLAQAADLVARRWPQRVTIHSDVELLAQALRDEDYAVSLVETYVEPVLGERDAGSLLRTLEALCAAGLNKEGVAYTLGVSRHTVQRRLARIEALVGVSLDGCRSEIQAALRLADVEAEPGAHRSTG